MARWCRQCNAVTKLNPISRKAASAQMTVANGRKPGNCTGSDAAATATMPVPMTDAYQFGVMFDRICRGCCRSWNSPHLFDHSTEPSTAPITDDGWLSFRALTMLVMAVTMPPRNCCR